MRALVLVALLAAPAAHAQVADRLADLRLATAVRIALVDDGRTRTLDVAVAARDGAVTVRGEVPPAREAVAAEVARSVPGVRRVIGLGDVPEAPTVTVRPVLDRPASGESADVPADAPAGPEYHTVRRGDTLFSLARRYDTTVGAILALNDLRSTDIRVGQRLRVR